MPDISLIGLYNAIMAKQHISFPKHLLAPAAGLEDDRIKKIMIMLGPASGKSTFVDTIFPVYMLGKNPNLSILSISAGEDLVNGFTKAAADIIEHSPIYKAAFPAVRPNKSLGWSTERGYFIHRPSIGDQKPSLISTGIDSRLLTGLHANIIIFDDLHDENSAFSASACQKVIQTYYAVLAHRDTAEGSKFICIGRRWSEFDIYQHFMNAGSWVSMILPAERGDGVSNLYWDILLPEGLDCVFTEGFAERQDRTVDQIRKKLVPYRAYYGQDSNNKGFFWPDYPAIRERCEQIKRGSPDLFQAIFQCNPGKREGSLFIEKDFKYFDIDATIMSPSALPQFFQNGIIVQSWDTSQKKNEDSDYSVCVTACAIPCNQWHNEESEVLIGAADPHFDIYILDIYRQKLEIQELIHQVRALHRIWNPSRIVMEDRSSGTDILSALQNAGLPLLGVKTENKSKRSRLLDRIGNGPWSAQGWIKQGRLLFWAGASWLEIAKTEMKNFTGDGSGHDDIVDAITYLVSYIINMGSAAPMLPTDFQVSRLEKPTLSELAQYDPRIAPLANFENILARAEFIDYPEVCATCKHKSASNMCLLHKRKVAGLDTCEAWQRQK